MQRLLVLFLLEYSHHFLSMESLEKKTRIFPQPMQVVEFSYGYTNVLIEYADGRTNELLSQDILRTIQGRMDWYPNS